MWWVQLGRAAINAGRGLCLRIEYVGVGPAKTSGLDLGSSEVTCAYRWAADAMGFKVVSIKLENSKVRRCDAGVY